VPSRCITRGDALGERGAPQWPQEVGAPLDLIGEGRHRDVEAEATQAFTLAMQRKPVDVLLDEQRRRETESDLAARDDLVARWRAHHFGFAFVARELLA
jgi:hypothetical protein